MRKQRRKGRAFPKLRVFWTLRAYSKTSSGSEKRPIRLIFAAMEPTPFAWHKLLIGAGAVLLAAGLLAWVLQGKLNWLGRLPGDIRIERENFRFYFPLTTMILLSLLLNAVIWVVRRFWN